MIKTSNIKYKILLLSTITLLSICDIMAQNEKFRKPFFGKIVNMFNHRQISNAHIVNMSSTKGTISNYYGEFKINVLEGDTLLFSEIGFHIKQIIVSKEMLSQHNVIKLITKNYKLKEVVVSAYYLTGILEVDVKNLSPVNIQRTLKIGNLKTSNEIKPSVHKTPSVFQPIDFIYNIFGSKPKEMKKLKKLEKKNHIKDLLYKKYDREFLMETLNLSRMQIESMLKNCDYDDDFIMQSNDLEILKAMLKCYDQYEDILK